MLKKLLLFILLLGPLQSFSHGGVKHSETFKQKAKNVYEEISSSYLIKIKPIIKRSCFNCHSNQITYPWYYKIPGVKQLIDSDIREAKKHLDFSSDFPFIGHGDPLKDLESISKVIKDNSMPPWKYRVMHRSERLSDIEKNEIEMWINNSIRIIKND